MSARALAALAATCGSLTFAAAASAATITVDPAAPAGCSGGVCKSITEAHGAAAAGDTISIKNGTFTESPIVITKANLTIAAIEPGKVTVTSSSTTAGANVITLDGGSTGTTLRGLVIRVQPNGGRAVQVNAPNTRLEQSTLLRQGDNAQDSAAYEVGDAATGTQTISGAIVLNDPSGGAADRNAPAVQGGDASSLLIVDSLVAAGARQRDAIALTGNAAGVANRLTRVGAFAVNPAANALSVLSAASSAVAKDLVVDSSILSAGANGAGLKASSAAGGAPGSSNAGNVTARLVHTTIAGSASGVVIDAAADGPGGLAPAPRGSIDVDVDRSILHGESTVTNHDRVGAGPLILSEGNTARLDITATDTPTQPSDVTGSTVTVTGASNTPDAALFRNAAGRNFHLRADAPVIDKAGPAVAGESDKDVDGEPRVSGAASDRGADEFVNRAPTAKIAVSKANPRQNEKITFDASKSTDPEAGAGGGIVEYRWVFGDGSAATTKTPTVEHAYGKVQSYPATVTVVDAQGAASAPAEAVTVNVGDGVAPKVIVATPTRNQKIKIFRTVVKRGERTRVRRTIRFFGTATDDVKLRGVALSLRRISVTRTRRARPSQSTRCTFFDGKSRFVVRSCRKAPIYPASLRGDGTWAFRIKKTVKLRPGVYQLTAIAIDANGNSSPPVRVRFRFV